MSYVTIPGKSGYCTGKDPGSAGSNDAGLRMYWELRCYTSAETVTIMGKSYSCAAGDYKLFYRLEGWHGINYGSLVRIIARTNTPDPSFVQFRNGSTPLWSMTPVKYSTSWSPTMSPYFGDNVPPATWYNVQDATYSDSYRVYPSGLISVSDGATLSLNLTYNVAIMASADYIANVSETSTPSMSVTVSGGKFTLSISQGAGTTATVKRGSTTLSNGATIYLNDSLTFTYSVGSEYNIATHTVNGTSQSSGYNWIVSGNSTVVTTATVKSFTLSISVGTGSSITVNRTSSPKKGAATGTLSNGATIYYSDVLKITFSSLTGYNLATHTVNGSSFTSGNTLTVSGSVTVVTTATVKSFSLSISAGTGSSITVRRTSSPKAGASTGVLSGGSTIYYSDVLTITFSANTGYSINTHTVNGTTFTSGNNHTVVGSVSVISTASVKTYALSIIQGTGSFVTVKRGSTTLYNGDTVSHFDVLTITFSANTGYSINTHTVNGTTFTSGNNYTVTGATSVESSSSVLSYALSAVAGVGSSISINRISSPKAGASTGVLSGGSTIYYSDVLTITFSANTGYSINTHTVNGTTFTSGNNHTVVGSVSVISTASVKTFLLHLNGDSGSIIEVRRTYSPIGNAASGIVTDGSTIYYSDVLEITTLAKPGYVFQSASLNGDQVVSPHSVTSDVTIVVITIAAGGYIKTASGFDLYQLLIRTQQSWDLYRIVIKTSQGWDTY